MSLQRLIKLLGMKTSIYNIETREATDGKAYIMECSPRGGGNRLAECIEYATGVKLVENAVRAALGMEIVGVEQKPYNGCWAEVILHSDKNGIYKELLISDEIKDNVFEKDLWVKKGEEVHSFTAANSAIGTLVLRFENDDRLQSIMADISKYVKVALEE